MRSASEMVHPLNQTVWNDSVHLCRDVDDVPRDDLRISTSLFPVLLGCNIVIPYY